MPVTYHGKGEIHHVKATSIRNAVVFIKRLLISAIVVTRVRRHESFCEIRIRKIPEINDTKTIFPLD